MPDLSVDLEAAELSTQVPRRVAEEARGFAWGVLLTVVAGALGTVVFTAALLAAVVGAPVVALAIAWLVVRHRRQARALDGLQPSAG